MFPKLNKKFLTTLILIIIAVLLVGFAGYKYVFAPKPEAQNNLSGEVKTENEQPKNTETSPNDNASANDVPQIQLQAGGIEATTTSGGDGFTVCSDKCGDGICQAPDPSCNASNNLNCVCLENKQECPQDCK